MLSKLTFLYLLLLKDFYLQVFSFFPLKKKLFYIILKICFDKIHFKIKELLLFLVFVPIMMIKIIF